MKFKSILFSLALMLCAAPAMAAWSIDGGTVVDRYVDTIGEHSVIKIVVTVDNDAGSFTTADLSDDVEKRFRGYMYYIAIDPEGTLTAAPQLTLTDVNGVSQFVDTTSFHATNTVKVTGNSYDGQFPHVTNNCTFTFNDVGDAADSFTIFIDLVR
jgi:hypothetical protein